MKKIVLKCPKCKKKMKITDKAAKYRCPSCKEVYNYTKAKQTMGKVTAVFIGVGKTAKDIKNGIVTKYKNTKSTYKYMKSMKSNMKNDPNWSNFHKEQKETKEMNKKNKVENFKDNLKSKFKKK